MIRKALKRVPPSESPQKSAQESTQKCAKNNSRPRALKKALSNPTQKALLVKSAQKSNP